MEQKLLETGESYDSYCYNIFHNQVWGDDLIERIREAKSKLKPKPYVRTEQREKEDAKKKRKREEEEEQKHEEEK